MVSSYTPEWYIYRDKKNARCSQTAVTPQFRLCPKMFRPFSPCNQYPAQPPKCVCQGIWICTPYHPEAIPGTRSYGGLHHTGFFIWQLTRQFLACGFSGGKGRDGFLGDLLPRGSTRWGLVVCALRGSSLHFRIVEVLDTVWSRGALLSLDL
jgi:hypothetical protein